MERGESGPLSLHGARRVSAISALGCLRRTCTLCQDPGARSGRDAWSVRIAVVGGAGFIGRHVVRRLIAAGHEICTVDLRAPGQQHPGERVVAQDLLREGGPEGAASAVGDAAGLVWLAASIRQVRAVDHGARDDVRLMVEAPLRFLGALGRVPTQVVYASSIQVYGRPEHLPVDEDHPKRPFTTYGVAKLCAEHYLRIACETMRAPLAILRVAFAYGPGQHTGNVIPRFLQALRRGEPPRVHGSGAGIRDDIYVEDIARSIERCLEVGVDGVFNIASGRPHTLLEVAEAACRIAGSGLRPTHESVDPRWVDRWYSVERVRLALGFSAETALDEGLRLTWAAMQE